MKHFEPIMQMKAIQLINKKLFYKVNVQKGKK